MRKISPSDFFRSEIDQEHVAVRPAGDNPKTALREHARHCAKIHQNLFLIVFELGIERFLECHRLSGNHVHQWPVLESRKHNRIERFRVLLGRGNEAAARAAKRLVCRTCNDVGDSNWVWIEPRCHQN